MSATAPFLAAWDRDARDPATLVKIELTSPSSLTLYLSSREEIATPGSPPQIWQGGVLGDVEPTRAPGAIMESAWSPCTSGITILNAPLAHQTGTDTALDLFSGYSWMNAAVTIYWWEKSLTSFADAFAQFFRVQDYEVQQWRATVRLIQRWDWNREFDMVPITRKRFPRAIEKSIGKFLPKVRGAVREIPMRIPPFAAGYDGTGYSDSTSHGHSHLVGGRRAVPGIAVDMGRGGDAGGDTLVYFTSHACKKFFAPHQGCVPYIDADGKLALFDADSTSYVNDSNGTRIKIGDTTFAGVNPYAVAFFPMPAVQIELETANNAENPRAALDVENDTSYARLDYDANHHYLYARLPSVAPLGDVVTASWCLIYSSVGSMANVIFRAFHNPSSGSAAHPGLITTATPVFTSFSTSPGTPTTPWQYGEIKLEVLFSGTPTGVSLKVYGIGAIIKYRPKREVVGRGLPANFIDRNAPRRQIPFPETFAPLLRDFGATLEGYADSGGTYTGNGTDLIERAPDIAHHVLVVEGGESSSDLTTATSTFGSFVDARALLKTWRQSDMVHALVVTEPERVASALERLGRDAGCWFYLDETTDKWKCIVWKANPSVDVTPKITVRDIGEEGLSLRPTPGTRRETGVRVLYGHDYFSRQPTQECGIGPGRSNSGHKYRNLRDQQFTIVDSGAEQNNKIDIHGAFGDATATVAAGAKTSAEMIEDVEAALESAQSSTWSICHGPTVVNNVNDRFTIQENEGLQDTFQIDITADSYATMEALATAVQTALNASSDSFTVTYSRTTRKFTIARAGNTFRIVENVAATANVALILLGFDLATTAYAASHTGTYEVEEEMFIIGNTEEAIDVEWETGTNGTNGNNINAGNVLGFDAARDDLDYSLAAPTNRLKAVCPTNTREQSIDTLSAATGERQPMVIDGQTIYDDDTAREVRDRRVDLMCANRPDVVIPLVSRPHYERGRVVEMDASPDDLWPYAVEDSDGSWAGKKFQITGYTRHNAGSYVTRYEAFEAS